MFRGGRQRKGSVTTAQREIRSQIELVQMQVIIVLLFYVGAD